MPAAAEAPFVDIPESKTEGGIVLPAFRLAADLAGFDEEVGVLAVKSPTPCQLMRGCKNSPKIMGNILIREHFGEALNISVGPGKGKNLTIVTPVERFVFTEHGWYAEGKRTSRELPNSGYQGAYCKVLYHPDDGLPVSTYQDKQGAVNSILEAGLAKDKTEAENLASYWSGFRKYRNEFSVVGREFYGYWMGGPLCLNCWSPCVHSVRVGFRAVENLPRAERDADS